MTGRKTSPRSFKKVQSKYLAITGFARCPSLLRFDTKTSSWGVLALRVYHWSSCRQVVSPSAEASSPLRHVNPRDCVRRSRAFHQDESMVLVSLQIESGNLA